MLIQWMGNTCGPILEPGGEAWLEISPLSWAGMPPAWTQTQIQVPQTPAVPPQSQLMTKRKHLKGNRSRECTFIFLLDCSRRRPSGWTVEALMPKSHHRDAYQILRLLPFCMRSIGEAEATLLPCIHARHIITSYSSTYLTLKWTHGGRLIDSKQRNPL